MAASIWDQPMQLSKAAFRPFGVSGQPDSRIRTSVHRGPTFLNRNSTVLFPPVADPQPIAMRLFLTQRFTVTGNAPGKSAKSHMTVLPVASGPLAPPVVK